MGAFSKVSGIVSPDVAPLTTVKRRLVVFALELGTQFGDTSISVSWPSINNLFSLIFCHPHVIFSTRHFRHNSGHQFTFPGFEHSLCALSRRRLGVCHFHLQCLVPLFFLCFSTSLSLSLIPYTSLQLRPLLDPFIRSFCSFPSSPSYTHLKISM